MDLTKNGNLLRLLRKEKKMTQKELADKLGVVPKTVSKWETGYGFPDVSTLSSLADVLGVNERILLSGAFTANQMESGNLKRTQFYVCPCCGSIMQGVGNCQINCCGRTLTPLQAKVADKEHALTITEIENDFYIELSHEMSKKHYISFVSYIGVDRVLTLRLYPEQDCAIRIPKAYTGKIVYYCNKHGLFEYSIRSTRKK